MPTETDMREILGVCIIVVYPYLSYWKIKMCNLPFQTFVEKLFTQFEDEWVKFKNIEE